MLPLGFRFDVGVVLLAEVAHRADCRLVSPPLPTDGLTLSSGEVYSSERCPDECPVCRPSFETLLSFQRERQGVEVAQHRFGGIEFRLGRRELGHLHGDRIADLPLPKRVRDELIAEGRALPHHVLPDTGWVTVPIAPGDVDEVIEIFRLSYDRATRARSARR
jgi:hypothetical protein